MIRRLFCIALLCAGQGAGAAPPNPLLRWFEGKAAYSLDEESRAAERDRRGRLQCPDVELEVYRGDIVRYQRPVRVHPEFRERLRHFEAIVARVGKEVYGRTPKRIRHIGAYNCRTLRRRTYRLSEHALGNALDVSGFVFGPRPRKDKPRNGVPRWGFTVDVKRHWDQTRGYGRTHALFLKTLVRELRKDDAFRGMIVPPAPGHKNHLHLDMGRWRYLRGDVTLPPES